MPRRLSVIVAAFVLLLLAPPHVTTVTALEEADRYWLVGRNAYEDKLYPLAIHALKRFTDLYPRHRDAPQGLLLLGKAYLDVKSYGEALTTFQRAQRERPLPGQSQELKVLEAETLVRLRRHPEAQAAYRTALAADPASPFTIEALYGLAWTARELKQSQEAVRNFREILARAPEHSLAPSARFYLALTLFEQKLYADALPILDAFLARHPAHEEAANARYLRGVSRIETGKASEGLADLREFIALQPSSELVPEARRRITATTMERGTPGDLAAEYRMLMSAQPSSAELLFDATLIAAKLGNQNDQLSAWTRLRREFPNDPRTRRASLDLARAAFARNEYRDALGYAEFATKSDDDAVRAEALLLKAEAELKLNQTAAALRDFKEVTGILSVDPSLRIRAVAGTAILQEEAQQWGEALRLYDEVAVNGRDKTLADWARGAVMSLAKRRLEAGDPATALEAARKAQRYDARDPEPHMLEAKALTALHQHSAAATAYGAVAKGTQSPLAADALWGRAEAELNAKQPDAAVLTLKEFADRWPESPRVATAMFLRARALVQDLKRPDEALPLLDAFLQRYPAHESAAEAQYLLGVAWLDTGKTAEGIAALRTFTATYPRHPLAATATKRKTAAQVGAGRASGDRAMLLEAFKGLMNESPATPDGLYDAGDIAGQLGRPADQEAAWRKLRREFPNEPLAQRATLQLAHAAFRKNAFAEVVSLAATAAQSPDDAVRSDAFLLVGEAELKQKRYAPALKAFSAALDTPGMDPGLRYRALAGSAIAHEEQKQYPDALTLYEEVAKKAPDDALRTWAADRARIVKDRIRTGQKPPAAPEKPAPKGGAKPPPKPKPSSSKKQ